MLTLLFCQFCLLRHVLLRDTSHHHIGVRYVAIYECRSVYLPLAPSSMRTVSCLFAWCQSSCTSRGHVSCSADPTHIAGPPLSSTTAVVSSSRPRPALLADPSATASAPYVDYRTYRIPATRVMQSGKSLCTFEYTRTHLSNVSALTNFVAKPCTHTSTTPQNASPRHAFCIHVSPFVRPHISPLTYYTVSVAPPSSRAYARCVR